jgi:hypothetical protein
MDDEVVKGAPGPVGACAVGETGGLILPGVYRWPLGSGAEMS